MAKPKYRRVIVKLSGEALSGPEKFGIHQPTIDRFAADLVAVHKLGVALGVVVGGGNVLRGAQISENGLSRPTADAMGMLATVMNALVMEAAIERLGASARTMSALAMPQVCETYERQRALRHLEDDTIIIFAGGTGNPYFTTDTTAVLRAAEMECDAVLKATDVDGVSTVRACPGKPDAYHRLFDPGEGRDPRRVVREGAFYDRRLAIAADSATT
jgi:uridylate kinase